MEKSIAKRNLIGYDCLVGKTIILIIEEGCYEQGKTLHLCFQPTQTLYIRHFTHDLHKLCIGTSHNERFIEILRKGMPDRKYCRRYDGKPLSGQKQRYKRVIKWTFCDGIEVFETIKSYEFLLEFNKELDDLIKRGATIESQKTIKDIRDNESGTEYLISSIVDFEKRWAYIYRKGSRIVKVESGSFIHVMYVAEKIKVNHCREALENQK